MRRNTAIVCERIERRCLLSGGIRDTSFGGDGAVTAAELSNPTLTRVGLQPDGKILVGGGNYVARLTANGQLDASFGVNGLSSALLMSAHGALAVAADGSYYLAASTHQGGNVRVARFSANGQQDLSFGTSGYVVTSIGSLHYKDDLLKVLSDGSLAIGNHNGGLRRISTSGVVSNLSANIPGAARDVLELPDGDLLVAYSHEIPISPLSNTARPAVVRVNADGTLDHSFTRFVDLSEDAQGLNKMTLARQSNGRILLTCCWAFDTALIALDPSGQADTSWGDNGRALYNFGIVNEQVVGTIVQPDDSLLFAVTSIIANSGANTSDVMIVHLNADGERDALFGVNGVARHNVPGTDLGLAIAQQADGRILLLLQPGLTGGELVRFSAPVESTPVSISSQGQLQIVGTGGDDVINVSESGLQYVVKRNGVEARVSRSLVSQLLIAGGAGDDSVTVGFQSDVPTTINGGSGQDIVQVLHPQSIGINVIQPQLGDGLVTFNDGSQSVSHANVESVNTGGSAPFLSAARFEMETRLALVLEFTHDLGNSLSASDLILRNLDNGTVRPIAEHDLVFSAAQEKTIATLLLPPSLDNAHWRLDLAPGTFTSAAGIDSTFTHRVRFDYSQGDTNGNGLTEFGDLVVIVQRFGRNVSGRSEGDVNYDGRVGFDDLLAVCQSFNLPTPALTSSGSSRLERVSSVKERSGLLA